MFRQMKVDVVGVVENMSYFTCPHCQHEVDIFSRGGAEKMAAQFGVSFLGNIALDPEVRKSGMAVRPWCWKAKIHRTRSRFTSLRKNVATRTAEIKANAPASVIQIQ